MLPPYSYWSEPDVQRPRVIETLSNVIVTPFETVNPVPATVTELCTGPCPGVTVIVGVVTVDDRAAMSPEPVSVTDTVVPEVPGKGTRRCSSMLPPYLDRASPTCRG